MLHSFYFIYKIHVYKNGMVMMRVDYIYFFKCFSDDEVRKFTFSSMCFFFIFWTFVVFSENKTYAREIRWKIMESVLWVLMEVKFCLNKNMRKTACIFTEFISLFLLFVLCNLLAVVLLITAWNMKTIFLGNYDFITKYTINSLWNSNVTTGIRTNQVKGNMFSKVSN